MEEKTLHFVEITDQEKRLLNMCRIFMDNGNVENVINEMVEDVVSEMVDHNIEEWALEELENVIKDSKSKEISLFPMYLDIKDKMFSNSKTPEIMCNLREQWRGHITKSINDNLVDLENIKL